MDRLALQMVWLDGVEMVGCFLGYQKSLDGFSMRFPGREIQEYNSDSE